MVRAYEAFGARRCVPIYNALDPSTHHPCAPQPAFQVDVALLANRLPDRESRVDAFFFKPAAARPERTFLLGGNGWQSRAMPSNVRYVGHVYTRDHNALNCSASAVLNINRESMARYGFSPPTRVFEAAGAGACLITDAWDGIEMFLAPGREVLVANDSTEMLAILDGLTAEQSRQIGQAALARVLAEHTYAHRVTLLEDVLTTMK